MMVSNVKAHDSDAITIHLWKRLCSDQPCDKLSSVRRNLFGICEKKDGVEKARAYDRSLDKAFRDKTKKASRIWNFDFVKGLPLPGKYAWQQVRSCETPSWYSATDRPTFKNALTRESSRQNQPGVGKSQNRLIKSETENSYTELKDVQTKKEQPNNKRPRLVQTSMKDFTRVQKRRSSRRLQLKQLQLYSSKSRLLRNHHHLPLHPRSVATIC